MLYWHKHRDGWKTPVPMEEDTLLDKDMLMSEVSDTLVSTLSSHPPVAWPNPREIGNPPPRAAPPCCVGAPMGPLPGNSGGFGLNELHISDPVPSAEDMGLGPVPGPETHSLRKSFALQSFGLSPGSMQLSS